MAEANGNLEIRYKGNQTKCYQEQDNVNASCRIGLENSEKCMQLIVSKGKCHINGIIDCNTYR